MASSVIKMLKKTVGNLPRIDGRFVTRQIEQSTTGNKCKILRKGECFFKNLIKNK